MPAPCVELGYNAVMSPSPPPPSKLFIRSEVLSVIEFLYTIDDPAKQDKLKQIKRLHQIPDPHTVQRILIKELQRAGNTRMIQIISELLMELGQIDVVQQPLWDLIQHTGTPDDIKDAANLILRQLGDQTDPNLYLEYLDDPAGLINRETERMLEISTRNPEALIDFIDFIFSLPVGEQGNLIRSLQNDYPPDYLLNIYMHALTALPPLETQELILAHIGEIRTPRAALFLHEVGGWFQQNPELAKVWKKSVNSLKLAGLYRPEHFDDYRHNLEQHLHPLLEQTRFYQCFATIPDGIGNQGIIVSRERDNGDVVMMSVAINDLHGIMDCFGFYELSKSDFHKLAEKFHEESSKVHASPVYCRYKLQQAEAKNRQQRFRIPYEYSCWKVLLDDVDPAEVAALNPFQMALDGANTQWEQASTNLYQHPDFSTWFLEEGDHPVVTSILEDVLQICARAMAQSTDEADIAVISHAFIEALDTLAAAMVHGLLSTEWRDILIDRLSDAAYLLNAQKANTFSALAATEVKKLVDYRGIDTPLHGFIKQYGRRCVEEDLLRLRQSATGTQSPLQNPEIFEQLVDAVLSAWEL